MGNLTCAAVCVRLQGAAGSNALTGIVPFLQGADVQPVPFLEELQPESPLFWLAMGAQDHTHPQCTCVTTGSNEKESS